MKAKPVALDFESGLALLRADTSGLRPLRLNDSLKVEQWVVAMGSSLVKPGTGRQVVLTMGVVSALHRSCGEMRDLVQMDAALMPGFSGGALLDLHGRVVAVILGADEGGRIDFAMTRPFKGIGYAVPATKATRLLREAKCKPQTKRRFVKLGKFEIHVVSDGVFRVDPKAFGKNDVKGRVLPYGAYALVDAGMGVDFEELVEGIERADSRKQVLSELKRLSISPEDVTHVILSHLHFDHVGGCTMVDARGHRRPTFAKATYWVQAGELEDAESQSPAYRFAYHPVQWEALKKAGVLKEISGDAEIIPGVKAMVTGGHTRWHQIVLVESEGQVVCYPSDLVPTASQLISPDAF